MILLEIAIACSLALAASVAFYPAIALGHRVRLGVLTVLLPPILLSPLLVPSGHRFARFLAAVLAVALTAKLYDLHLGARRGHRPDLRTFLAFLPNLASVVLRKLDAEPRPSRRDDLTRLAGVQPRVRPGGAPPGRSVPGRLGAAARRRRALHKVVAFFLTLVPATAAGVAAWRLLGGRAREPMDNPFAARTPADFWKRYNRPAQQFFYEDVFKPLGGLRSPVRATLGTFAVSAVLHEYLFDIAVGRVQGYQMAFFLTQGLAVAATRRVKPRGGAPSPGSPGPRVQPRHVHPLLRQPR